MNGISIRGARTVLPLLFVFCAFPILAATPTSYVDLYRVFHMPFSEVSGWLKKDQSDRLKDVFLARYHLPLAGRGGVRQISVDTVKSYNGGQEYASIYIEAPKKETYVFFVSGILRGTVAVNGEQKGVLSASDPFGHLTIELTVEPGVYSVLFSFEPGHRNAPLVILADREVTPSSRGFTKKFRSSVKIKQRSFPGGELAGWLYDKNIFPVPQDDEKGQKAWGGAFGKASGPFVYEEKQSLAVLLRNMGDDKAKATLKKAGFTEEMLTWWRERLSREEVHGDVQEP